MGGIFSFTGIVLFIIGSTMSIVRSIKKTNKRTPIILLTIGIISAIVGFSLSLSNEVDDNSKRESLSSDIQTTTPNSSNKSLTQSEEFLEANSHG